MTAEQRGWGFDSLRSRQGQRLPANRKPRKRAKDFPATLVGVGAKEQSNKRPLPDRAQHETEEGHAVSRDLLQEPLLGSPAYRRQRDQAVVRRCQHLDRPASHPQRDQAVVRRCQRLDRLPSLHQRRQCLDRSASHPQRDQAVVRGGQRLDRQASHRQLDQVVDTSRSGHEAV